jgi:hypothetical protein
MLEIDVVLSEMYDEETEKFLPAESCKVTLEHSLVSASKWESIWKEAFLSKKEKTSDQTISYIRCMILTPDLPPEVFQKLVEGHLSEIQAYIIDEATATTLRQDPNAPPSREIITTELIYYWMISLNIPVEFQHWHLNRLITLIRVINLKNAPAQKRTAAQRREENRRRLKQFNTTG